VSKNNEDSDYIQHLSTLSSSLSLLAGFAFTAITVLLALLPDPSLLLAQVTLFFLVFLLGLLNFLISSILVQSLLLCRGYRNLPKPKRGGVGVFNLLVIVSYALFGVVVLFMLLLFNLIYLTLVSGVVFALFIILGYVFTLKPFFEYQKRLSSQK